MLFKRFIATLGGLLNFGGLGLLWLLLCLFRALSNVFIFFLTISDIVQRLKDPPEPNESLEVRQVLEAEHFYLKNMCESNLGTNLSIFFVILSPIKYSRAVCMERK